MVTRLIQISLKDEAIAALLEEANRQNTSVDQLVESWALKAQNVYRAPIPQPPATIDYQRTTMGLLEKVKELPTGTTFNFFDTLTNGYPDLAATATEEQRQALAKVFQQLGATTKTFFLLKSLGTVHIFQRSTYP